MPKASLRNKVFLFLLATFMMIGLVEYFIGNYSISSTFLQLEQHEARKNIHRSNYAIDAEISNLERVCADWANWTDTYEYVQNLTKDYEKSNLVVETLINLQIQLLLIIDENNEVVWGKVVDDSWENEISLKGLDKKILEKNHPVFQIDNHDNLMKKVSKGVLLTEYGPLLFASKLILKNDGSGPPKGTFIMGRFLSDSLIEKLRSQTQVSFDIILPGGADLASKYDLLREKIGINGQSYIETLDKELVAYASYPDLNSKSSFIIRTSFPRESSEIFENALSFDLLHQSILNLFVILMLQVFLYKSVLQPIENLTDFMLNLKRNCNFDDRVAIQRFDEIGILADETNAMVRTIAEQTRLMNNQNIHLENLVKERTAELNRSLYDTEKARDRISSILQSVADGLVVTDRHNRVVVMNRAAEDLLDVRFSTVMDRPIEFAIRDESLRNRMSKIIEKKSTSDQFDFELSGNDLKHPRVMRARTSIIQQRKAQEFGTVTIISDVTHEREVDRMKSEFVSTAAHELRTPLTSIQGFSEVLLTRDTLKPEEREKFLTYINHQAVTLGNIINDLLSISRIESGQGFALDVQPCDVGDILRSAVAPFRKNNPDHSYAVSLPEDGVRLNGDPDKLGQVMKNLLGNATKYSPDGGPVRVTGRGQGAHCQVSVEDEGIGMTPDQAEKVFDKFFRADGSNSAIEGTGLGMTIVKQIVEAHGGQVWVESELGKGTTVRFNIPLNV